MPGDKWRCISCLGKTVPGRDSTSKSMSKMVEYGHQMREVFDLEAEGSKPEELRGQAEWARFIAAEIRKQGMVNSGEEHGQMEKLSPHRLEVPLRHINCPRPCRC